MAVGGVPTLMDVNWQQVGESQKLKRQENFILDYTRLLRDKAVSFVPKLSYDGSNMSYAETGGNPVSDTELWNNYKQNSESRGIKPDVTMFDQQILPYYKKVLMQGFNQQLGALTNTGVSTKKYHKLYKKNPQFKAMLDKAIQSTDPSNEGQLSLLRTLVPTDEGEGLWSALKEDPLSVVVPGAIGVGAARAVYDKAKKVSAKGGKYPSALKHLRTFGPAGLAMTADPLSQMLGATKTEGENIGRIASGVAGGVYGYRGAQNVMKNRLLGSMVAPQTRDQLVKTAKKLGLKNVKANTQKAVVKELVENKIKGQAYKKTQTALGKTAVSSAWKKFLAKAGAKQVMGTSMPGWGNLAMAALTIPDIYQLGKALFGGDEQATPTNEIAVPPK